MPVDRFEILQFLADGVNLFLSFSFVGVVPEAEDVFGDRALGLFEGRELGVGGKLELYRPIALPQAGLLHDLGYLRLAQPRTAFELRENAHI